ncbi:MAG TPA: helix-turn-helix domain-containing protein [Daejeonella sp.]|uniref:helix-turn-helix domain-containing protein n=1 Tax=Daejeonella sp. TaxID=2805397 RepID=UPI002EDAA7BF
MSKLAHIIEILERMEKKQNEFFSELRAMNKNWESATEQWVDSLEVQKILGISRRTLYRIRVEKILSFKRIRGRYYYFTPDIFKIKDHYLK